MKTAEQLRMGPRTSAEVWTKARAAAPEAKRLARVIDVERGAQAFVELPAGAPEILDGATFWIPAAVGELTPAEAHDVLHTYDLKYLAQRP